MSRSRARPGYTLAASLLPRHLAVQEHVVVALLRQVALEAGGELGAGVHRLGGRERLIFPLAVADVVGILPAPAATLLHHGVAVEIAFDEAAVRALLGIALRVELRLP